MIGYSYPYKICDPVHGFIRFDDLEKGVIDSRPFQRLRYLHQMGVSYLLFPGATHSRFEHSLGVMELASRIYDALISSPHRREAGELSDIPEDSETLHYWRRILRLAALCHDMGHLPFSHTAEPDLLPGGGHELKTLEIVRSAFLRPFWGQIGPNAEEDLIKLCISEKEQVLLGLNFTLTPWEKVLSQAITADNFGADRIDYLIRDATYTGVGYGHFDYHQLIDTLRILPALKDPSTLSIGVTESGVPAIESLWIARYLMYCRVYHHPRCRVHTLHMRRYITNHYNACGFPSTVEGYIDETDFEILSALAKDAKKGSYDAKVLLKEESSYKEIHAPQLSAKALIDLKSRFGTDLFIDDNETKKGEDFRYFTVLTESGEKISSVQASSFLRDIPLGGKPQRLFAADEQQLRIKERIADLLRQ